MILDGLSPAAPFRWFEAICAIPHGSGNTAALSDFCVRFAAERGLEHYRDSLGNVILIAPAAPGYENAAPIILQGHLDMVCALAPGVEKDMTAEGPELFCDGDTLGARGSSLGGDDGAAVAIILALLDDPTLPRPRLEAVLTVDEEVGMTGARGLDVAPLRGRTMLNLDSEEEGIFTVSCAGGARATLRRCAAPEPAEGLLLTLGVEGLLGGHSGTEIDKGRANACILLGRVLDALRAVAPLHLLDVTGGTADNAIPSRCQARFLADPEHAMALLDEADRLCAALRMEYLHTEANLRLRLETGGVGTAQALSEAETGRFIAALCALPNGVQTMNTALGLPETSCNLGLLSLDAHGWTATVSLRSSVPEGKPQLLAALQSVSDAAGAEMEVRGDYPGWAYRAESPLRARMERIYEAMFGKRAVVTAIHAGLECGILAEKLPGLDCVSIGPEMLDIHTASERMRISSMARTWDFVKAILRESR